MGHHSLKVPRAAGGLRALRGRRLQREGETEEEKQRWAEIGCTAGGQTEEGKKIKYQENKSQGFSLGCDTHPKSPSSENEEADDEGLEVSKSAS